jgi:four helix bundle protein
MKSSDLLRNFGAHPFLLSPTLPKGRHDDQQREFRQFLAHSQGSPSEVDTELVISHRLAYLKNSDYERLTEELDHIGRMITRLSQRLTKTKVNQ